MSGSETHSIEIELPEEIHDQIESLDSRNRDAFLQQVIERELNIQKHIEAVKKRQSGQSTEPPGLPQPGPLDSPIGALLGFELESLGEGEATLSMTAGRRHANRGGPVQGGVLTALADTATAFAFMTTLDEGESTTNVELKINFLRPVFEDELLAEARVVERGRTIGLVECDVRNAADKLVARMSTTYMVLRGDRAADR